jgi:hypothetical protein
VAEDLERLDEAAGALTRLLRERAGRAGFMLRLIASLAGFGGNLVEQYGEHSDEEAARYAVTRENRRDRLNAENLRWLIDTAFAGRKIMVWAHNAHVMNAWYGRNFDSVSLEPLAEGMKPSGVWLADWYGNALYKIGFTTYHGSDGWVGAAPVPVPPAPAGSVEERLHQLGAPEVFLPLPSTPVSMRIPKYKVETFANPAQPFDALYFVNSMTPATSGYIPVGVPGPAVEPSSEPDATLLRSNDLHKLDVVIQSCVGRRVRWVAGTFTEGRGHDQLAFLTNAHAPYAFIHAGNYLIPTEQEFHRIAFRTGAVKQGSVLQSHRLVNSHLRPRLRRLTAAFHNDFILKARFGGDGLA